MKVGRDVFIKKTKGIEGIKRIDMTKTHAPVLCQLLDTKASNFGKMVTNIPISYDGTGNVTATANRLTD